MFIEPTIAWVPSGFSEYIGLDTKTVLKKIEDDHSDHSAVQPELCYKYNLQWSKWQWTNECLYIWPYQNNKDIDISKFSPSLRNRLCIDS